MVVCEQCDSRDSPAGWIAFMQCYNMPRQLVKGERAHAVEILEEAESTAKGEDSKQLVTLIQPRNHESQVSHLRGGSLDYYPTEHVLCCGHQMHEACFESYRSCLKQQHYGSNSYEGVSQAWCNRCLLSCLIACNIVSMSQMMAMAHY
jgi:hypothetical protein